MLVIDPAPALGQPSGKKSQPSPKAEKDASKKTEQAGEADDQAAPPAAPDVAGAAVADPSKTRRVEPIEVFTDEKVEELLDLAKLKTILSPPVTPTDVARVQEMAKNPNARLDSAVIDQVVKGLAAQLTDKKSIQSLLEEPDDQPPPAGAAAKKAGAPAKGDAGRAIQTATTALLEPIFMAQATQPPNDAFLRDYRRSLHTHLTPLLSNHLVPRVQAMIVLGEAANPTSEGLKLFQNEVASKSQALWVKLWALEGISNIKKGGGGRGLSADEEARAGRAIADFLKAKDKPWPIELRGLQAMGWLRQASLPTQREAAPMANVAMSFLSDPEARLEVRAEAARALGLMHTGGIPRYNHRLVAASAGRLVADLGSAINALYSDTPPRAENPTKATYLLALLVGPTYQCFDGVEGQTNSGVLRTGAADPNTAKYIQEVFKLVRPIAQTAINLRGAPSKEYKKRKQDLAAGIQDLRNFLDQNPPEGRRLVPGGPEFSEAGGQAEGALLLRPAQALVQARRGR
jgi:hypothetical protein